MRWFILSLLLVVVVFIGVFRAQAEPEPSPRPPVVVDTQPNAPKPIPPKPKIAVIPSRTVVATVNVGVLLNRAPQSAAATEKLKQKYAPVEAEIEREQRAIQELQDQLSQLEEEGRLQKDRDLRSRQRNYERAVEDYRAELRLARDEQLGLVQKQVVDAINTIRIQNKIDIVLKENDYIAASPQVDITDQVLEYLQQQFNNQSNNTNTPITKEH
ncbi:OmpH family outer membrane protein [Thiofilum flexile]|uniref:OmpH family outer membrane protein n=1 Tax=Thiofilum flexile TaxID=125627 RepID=UPI0003740B18|nr:OmpH family outer membrane protein [Thiofilum flexile]